MVMFKKPRLNMPMQRFYAAKRGATAVEFALLGPIFIALILSLFEMGLVMMKITFLDDATSSASKIIYTGAANGNAVTQQDLAVFICDNVHLFSNCEQNITVELTPINTFSDAPTTNPTCTDSTIAATLNPVVTFDPGSASQVMFMRVCISTNVVTPGLGIGLGLSNSADRNRQSIVSQTAFLNEPF